jgi:predicted dehydrogenase
MEAFREGRQPVPNFKDGVKCQQVLEAVEQSVQQSKWIKVSDL